MRTLFLKDSFINDLDLAAYSHDRYQTSLNQAPHLSDETETERKRYNIAYLNIKWFMQTLLDRMDRTSMYSGLEAVFHLPTTASLSTFLMFRGK